MTQRHSLEVTTSPVRPRPSWGVLSAVGAALICLAALAGCASPEPVERPTVAVDETGMSYVPLAVQRKLQQAWAPSLEPSVRRTSLDEGDAVRVRTYIARRAELSLPPCRVLQLTDVEPQPLEPFTMFDPVQARLMEFKPERVHEIWVVSTCGRTLNWRVFTSGNRRTAELSVILVRGR